MRLVDQQRYQELKASGRLPSPRGLAFAIINLLKHADFQVEDLVQLAQSDPAISGRLLKFANAAAGGAGRPIVSIAKAVGALGAFRVRDLVLGFSVLSNHRHGTCPRFDYSRFWSRALASAISAQALAPWAQIDGEEFFTAGLLSSIGELALVSIYPDTYGEVAVAPAHDRSRLENEKFGMNHRELGATLLLDWGLPGPIARAAYHCESPEDADLPDGSRDRLLTLALHLAQAMAEVCVADESDRWHLVPGLYAKAAALGIGAEDLTRLADRMTTEWHEWGRTLDIRTLDIPSFSDLLTATPPREPETSMTSGPATEGLALIAGLAEDDARPIAHVLQSTGYRVEIRQGSVEALMTALRDSPRLVFLPVPEEVDETAAFCRALRDSPMGQHAFVLLLAPASGTPALSGLLEAGADDFLTSPVTEDLLRARLRVVEQTMQLQGTIQRERIEKARSAGEWAGTQRRLIQVAMTDPLTQLPNRRHGTDFLSAEWVFASTNGLALSCLMMDIDHFKVINDTHGHKAGDAVLVAVARMLQASARNMDMVFRYGGEEFCMICPGADMATAQMIGERIRRATEAEPFMYDETPIPVTMSIGVSTLSPDLADGETLIRQADSALYQAKQNGRNRVCCYSTETKA